MATVKNQKKWRENLVIRGVRLPIRHHFNFSEYQKNEMKRLRNKEFWTLIELAEKYKCWKDTIRKIVGPWSVYYMRPNKNKKILQSSH